MTEAVHRLREFHCDRRVDLRVVTFEGILETSECRGELVEDDSVVLHLCAKLRSLEDATAIPVEVQKLYRIVGFFLMHERSVRNREVQFSPIGKFLFGCVEPLVELVQVALIEYDTLGDIRETIVLTVKDAVNGGERDILVATTVSTHEVHPE